jgi:hypothetical protein
MADPNRWVVNCNGYEVPVIIVDPTDTTSTFLKNINSNLALLNINKSTADDVIRVLGEPWSYSFRGNDLKKDNLPEVYNMAYPGNFIVSIHKNHVMLWGTQQIPKYIQPIPGYIFPDSIQIGTTLDEVFKELGPPAKIVEGFGDESNKIMYEDNVIYQNMNINERKGFCFFLYDSNGEKIRMYFDDNILYQDVRQKKGCCFYGTIAKGKRIRITFMDNKVVELYEYRTEPIKTVE